LIIKGRNSGVPTVPAEKAVLAKTLRILRAFALAGLMPIEDFII